MVDAKHEILQIGNGPEPRDKLQIIYYRNCID